MTSKIEWTDETWNPVTGCDRVSDGCTHCYALTMAKRLKGMGAPAYQNDGDPRTSGPGFAVTLQPDKLDLPIRWTKPRKIFVNSMSDLFHKDIPDEYIARVFAVMAVTPRHTYQLLTKRHARMRSLLDDDQFVRMVWNAMDDFLPLAKQPDFTEWPLGNVIVGVSVENQQWADIRIPALLETPAVARFLSMEPLLGPVDITNYLPDLSPMPGPPWSETIDWVIVGGESGKGARPMHPEWAKDLLDQCTVAGVPYLFKQWGEWAPHRLDGGEQHVINHRLSKNRDQYESVRFSPAGVHYKASEPNGYSLPGMTSMLRVGKKKAGRLLAGRTYDGYPELTL